MAKEEGIKTVVVHVCCAPDATVAFERLRGEFLVIPFFCNPNIHPESEYSRRLWETARVCESERLDLKTAGYETREWLRLTAGLDGEPEGGERCLVCYRMRLEETAKFARDNGHHFFTTVLTVSPHKRSRTIITLGEEVGKESGIPFLAVDFKKKDGFKRSLELSRQMNLYRQKYCGCIYSQKENPDPPAI